MNKKIACLLMLMTCPSSTPRASMELTASLLLTATASTFTSSIHRQESDVASESYHTQNLVQDSIINLQRKVMCFFGRPGTNLKLIVNNQEMFAQIRPVHSNCKDVYVYGWVPVDSCEATL